MYHSTAKPESSTLKGVHSHELHQPVNNRSGNADSLKGQNTYLKLLYSIEVEAWTLNYKTQIFRNFLHLDVFY